eukprot:TRINITY_DN109744_c0_g1_i1.p1 TRINITY_DN109744_c0_g1~~TRINITY_DN109744_c0_g1_i1.p1  ORF type:complete len:307 (-),score=39.72 TRINITY_DN109744_c0_g1_i1:116-1036(-)
MNRMSLRTAKRALSAYDVFRNSMRGTVRNELQASLNKSRLSSHLVMSRVAQLWREMPESEKANYRSTAADMNSCLSASQKLDRDSKICKVPEKQRRSKRRIRSAYSIFFAEEGPQIMEHERIKTNMEEEPSKIDLWNAVKAQWLALPETRREAYVDRWKALSQVRRRPLNGYQIYVRECFASVRQEHSDSESFKMPTSEVLRALARQWRTLPELDKLIHCQQADTLNDTPQAGDCQIITKPAADQVAAFELFCSDQRQAVVRELRDMLGVTTPFRGIVRRELHKRWQAMPDTDKQQYRDRAANMHC